MLGFCCLVVTHCSSMEEEDSNVLLPSVLQHPSVEGTLDRYMKRPCWMGLFGLLMVIDAL